MIHRLAQIISYLLFKIFFGLEIIGKENIPKKGGFIIASNHISYLDPVIIGGAILPRRSSFMAKEDLFKKPFNSFMLRRLRAFPVRRDSADLTAIKNALFNLKKAIPLVLFPEGTTSNKINVSMNPKPGLGFIASKSGVSIIPTLIKGSDIALPRGSKQIYFHKIQIIFGKPMNEEIIEKGGKGAYKNISRLAMEHIRRLGYQ